MTNPSEDLLTSTEGVDEGSAKSSAEQSEATPAPPVDMGIDAPRGPGQQLEAGEG